MLPRNVLYYGKEEPLPERTALRAGPLSLIYEDGGLRNVRLGEREILRRVYVALRDRGWGTVPHRLSNVQMDLRQDAFEIAYDAEHCAGEIDFVWHGRIAGDPDGGLTFSLAGEARSSFVRTRIGFCVLHPIRECGGAAARIHHVDGTIDETTFPVHIAPQHIVDGEIKPVPPFAEMAAMSHEVMPGIWAEVRFSGDIFEMEDQRNWLDASYKTYSPPLRLPWPVEVHPGTKVVQSITLTLQGTPKGIVAASRRSRSSAQITLAPTGAAPRPLSRVGLGGASHGQPLTDREMERLAALRLSHLRVDLRLSEPGYEAALRRAWVEARALGIGLEAAIFVSDSAAEEMKLLLSLLDQIKPKINQWLVFHSSENATSDRWVALASQILRSYDTGARLGSGTDLFFAELNRQRPSATILDLITYSITPQAHAFDNASVTEGLEAIPATVNTARQFTGAAQLVISPVTLRRRYVPHSPPPGEMPPQVDERQMSLFGAGWTAGCLKYLAESGVNSATFYETSGWRGVMETEGGSPLPKKFRSLPGAVFPLYHVLADVGEFAAGEVIPTASSDPLRMEGLALRKGGRMRVLLANLSSVPQRVVVQIQSENVSVRALDETNAEEAMESPEAFRAGSGEARQTVNGRLELELLPYAVVRIDGV